MVGRLGAPLVLSSLNEFEFINATALAEFRGVLGAQQGMAMRADFESDIGSGGMVLANCNLASVLREAKRLAATHTQTRGYRAFDILHVAAALHLGAGEFLSFDRNQRALAAAENLVLNQ
jgi:predicted nucleic acid-binding protein